MLLSTNDGGGPVWTAAGGSRERQGQLTESQWKFGSAPNSAMPLPAPSMNRSHSIARPLDKQALRKAAHDLVQRHEALRIRFARRHGLYRAAVAPLAFTVATDGEAATLDPSCRDHRQRGGDSLQSGGWTADPLHLIAGHARRPP